MTIFFDFRITCIPLSNDFFYQPYSWKTDEEPVLVILIIPPSEIKQSFFQDFPLEAPESLGSHWPHTNWRKWFSQDPQSSSSPTHKSRLLNKAHSWPSHPKWKNQELLFISAAHSGSLQRCPDNNWCFSKRDSSHQTHKIDLLVKWLKHRWISLILHTEAKKCFFQELQMRTYACLLPMKSREALSPTMLPSSGYKTENTRKGVVAKRFSFTPHKM